jgi:lipopolysaccharide biosynthesis regulator YciM
MIGTVNNLGNLYRDRGELDAAEEMYMQALTKTSTTLGECKY